MFSSSFTTWDCSNHNLNYNASLVIVPFICECCTVQTVLKTKLQDFNQQHRDLLASERMQMIDTFNRCSKANPSNYKSALRTLHAFQHQYMEYKFCILLYFLLQLIPILPVILPSYLHRLSFVKVSFLHHKLVIAL